MKLKDIVTLETSSVNPQNKPESIWHLYSLPSFDEGKQCEQVLGKDIMSNKYLVPNKCILFNKLNVRFKRIWAVFSSDEYTICSTEFLPLVVNEDVADFDFVYHLLHSDQITNYLTGQNTNTSGSHKRIDPTDFLNIDVIMPSIEEQKRIGAILSNIERKIELNSEINQNLDAMAKQLYDYWFMQFDFPNEEGKPYRANGGKMVWNEKLKREIPECWESATIESFLIIKNGKDHKHLEDGDYPVYGSGGLMRKVSQKLYEGESVLMPRKGTLNNIMYVNEAFWTVDTMFYSQMRIQQCAKYVYYAIKDYDFTRWDSGTGVPSMTSSTLYALAVVKPDEKVLKLFDERISPLFAAIKQHKTEIENLIRQRDELLPLLMNGQVSVTQLNSDLSHD